MKNRVKIFSYVILLANIILLAHSFVPHDHFNYTVASGEGNTLVTLSGCSCSSCSNSEVLSMPGDTANGCGCCSHGGSGCFIKYGYLSQHGSEVTDIALFFIAPITINLIPAEETISNSYAELVVSLPTTVLLNGVGMRAPPVLFS